MTALPDDIELLVNGTVYSGWKAVTIRQSLDSFASSFDLTLTDTQAGEAKTIKLGSPCQVRIGGEKLITGFVDRIRPRYDSKSRGLTVSGRSKVADLVDCTLPQEDFDKVQRNSQTLAQLAGFVCAFFSIKATSTINDLGQIKLATMDPSQTGFEFLEKHARAAAVRLIDDQDGNLVITRAGDERAPTALVLGENIMEAEGEFSERDRFSHYYIVAQGPNWNDDAPEVTAHVTGKAEDLHVRYRPTAVIAEGGLNSAEAKRRAEWQRNVQYGRSRQATYTVNGWRHRDGLWRRNTLVKVIDPWMGFIGKDGQGEWLTIGTVEFVMDGGGKRTRLTVMPKEAYDLIPLPVEDAEGWG